MTFQAKLTTKLEDYSINDAIIELANDVERDSLDEIIKSSLKQLEKYNEKELDNRSFDFLIGGRLLRLNVENHLKLYADEIDANEVLSEKLVEIEYILSLKPPKPLEAVQHDDWVSCVDANDSYIISGSYDNSIRIFSAHDRKSIAILPDAHSKPITKVKLLESNESVKKNEMYFISCGHDEVSILRKFNTKTRVSDVVYIYQGHSRSVNCIDIQDDLIATGSFDKTLRLWSMSTEEQIENSQDDQLESTDATKKNKRQKTKASERAISKIRRNAIMTLTGHSESITGVKWLGSYHEFNSLASCSMDRSICIWDIEVGKCKSRVHSTKPVLGLDFCRDRNAIITASCDRFIRVWDARAPENAGAKAAYSSHTAWVSSVAFGPASTSHFISGGYDNVVKLWDIRSSKACLYDLIGHHDKVLDVNWKNPAYVLSGSADSTLKVFATE